MEDMYAKVSQAPRLSLCLLLVCCCASEQHPLLGPGGAVLLSARVWQIEAQIKSNALHDEKVAAELAAKIAEEKNNK